MAHIYDEHIGCSECGCGTFKEEVVCSIRKEASKSDRSPAVPLSDRFLDDKKIRYACTNCGKVAEV